MSMSRQPSSVLDSPSLKQARALHDECFAGLLESQGNAIKEAVRSMLSDNEDLHGLLSGLKDKSKMSDLLQAMKAHLLTPIASPSTDDLDMIWQECRKDDQDRLDETSTHELVKDYLMSLQVRLPRLMADALTAMFRSIADSRKYEPHKTEAAVESLRKHTMKAIEPQVAKTVGELLSTSHDMAKGVHSAMDTDQDGFVSREEFMAGFATVATERMMRGSVMSVAMDALQTEILAQIDTTQSPLLAFTSSNEAPEPIRLADPKDMIVPILEKYNTMTKAMGDVFYAVETCFALEWAKQHDVLNLFPQLVSMYAYSMNRRPAENVDGRAVLTNRSLFDNDAQLRPYVTSSADFVPVPEDAWKVLVSHYGIPDTMVVCGRVFIDTYDRVQYDLRPVPVRVTLMGRTPPIDLKIFRSQSVRDMFEMVISDASTDEKEALRSKPEILCTGRMYASSTYTTTLDDEMEALDDAVGRYLTDVNYIYLVNVAVKNL
eukprot:PhM_4_TR17414/c0_g1_i5/m.29432